ncbi:MAG TPA: efflux transporter outer membrane subunit [Rhodocyclaceae bacterium]
MRTALALAAAFAVAACSVGEPYRRPEVAVPASFRPEEPAIAASPSLGELDWWDVFRDPPLRRLLETALANNRDLRLASSRIAEASALAGQAREAQWPQLDLGLGAQRGRVVQNSGYVTGGVFTGAVDASLEVDLWRRLASQADAARANLLASQAGRDAVEVGLMGSVATAWFSLLALDREAAVASRAIGNRERFFDLTRRMAGRGSASGLDVSRAEASLAQAQASLPELRRQIAQTENQLDILLGGNPGPVPREADAEAPLPALPDVPAGLPSTLLERRPDLLRAEASLAAATANANATKAALFPTITLTGSYGSESFALSQLFSGPSRVWTLGAQLLQPIVNAQRNRYAVDAARAREQQAALTYQSAVAQAFREVADALAARRSYAEAAAAQQRQVAALRAARARVLRRYEIGASSYFEVIDADSALLAAELQLVEAQRNGLAASVQLYQALGGGWNRQRLRAVPAALPVKPQAE